MDPAMLELHENVAVGDAGPIRADGLVPLHIIRPGVGRGRGRHLYEADMLKRAVEEGRFTNWKMYVDHQAPEAKKAQGGLPRSVRDLGGIIKEAWWDDSVPADPERGFGQGAVVGLAKPTRLIASLIEDDPQLVEASISATATGVRPVKRGSETVWLVEGIRPRGSVDWVTEAGAGGRVAPLIEALIESDDFEEELEMAETAEGPVGRDDDTLMEWLVTERPDLLERIVETAAELEDDDKPDAGTTTAQEANEGGDVPDASELLQEALDSDEGRALLDEAIRGSFARVVAPALQELVEAAMEDERDLLRAEGKAEASRMLEVRDLKDVARSIIAESNLPEPFQVELRERYDVVGNVPTSALDVIDEEDAEGAVVKTAEAVLRENLTAEIARKRSQAASVRPTRVRGQGTDVAESTDVDADGKKVEKVEGDKTTGSFKTDSMLAEAGIEVDADLYKGILQGV